MASPANIVAIAANLFVPLRGAVHWPLARPMLLGAIVGGYAGGEAGNRDRQEAAQARVSLYDEVTAKIIAELEAGRFPWVQEPKMFWPTVT